jgi:hypothetical protein
VTACGLSRFQKPGANPTTFEITYNYYANVVIDQSVSTSDENNFYSKNALGY